MSSTATEKLRAVLRKAVAINSKPTEETFPELPEVLVWIRFCIAVGYGIFLGLKGVRSGFMCLQALNLITFLPIMYCRFFLGAESGHFESQVIFSGTLNAVALCLLIWIYFFAAEHTDQERRLADLLISMSIPGGDDASGVLNDGITFQQNLPVMEEPEF
jgi:hypothetical protein